MRRKSDVHNDVCPSDEILSAFSLGDLPEEVVDSIREHQESCSTCEFRVRQFDNQIDPVIETIRRTVARDRVSEELSKFDGLENRSVPRWPKAAEAAERACANPPIVSDYDIGESLLGRGGMGVVYKARHLKLNRVVALKMIAGRSRSASELFQIEAKAFARLQHPNIVQIFDIGTADGQPFLALEFVEGGSLDQRIAGRPQPPRAAAEMIRTLALAADYAHRQGIVHCDLKPSNILITPEGVPKIADFGVAKWLESDDLWSEDGRIVGTPHYMAPEQASGQTNSVGPATDVYSLGVILYEMLTGRPPHYSSTSLETLTLVCQQEPVSPRRLQPRLSRDLETVVLKCLRKEAGKRYGSAKLLAEDLERFLIGKPILARQANRAERAFIWTKRHQRSVSLIAVMTTFWIAIFSLFYLHHIAMVRWYSTELKSVIPAEPKLQPGNHPERIVQAPDGSIHLNAVTAAIFGPRLVYETRFSNLGFWVSPDDRAIWTFQVDRPTRFAVSLVFASDPSCAGNKYQVRVGDAVFDGTVTSTGVTGDWSKFQSFPAGEVLLPAGVHHAEVRPARPIRNALFDLREVRLEPR
jgi:eukaryotic-like serine/threonine-protein kinase